MTAADRLRDASWHWAGDMPFADAVARNHADAAAARRDERSRVLLFEPASPVLTLGRRAQTEPGRCELEDTLALADARVIKVIDADRGGLATLHLPGQLVMFVAIPQPLPAIRELVCAMLTAARSVAVDHAGMQATIDVDRDIGVWAADGKLASIGLRVRDRCVLHGMSLNVAIDRDLAGGLALCGSATKGYSALFDTGTVEARRRAVARAAEALASASSARTAERPR